MNATVKAVKKAAHEDRQLRSFSTVTRTIPSKKGKEKKLSTKCWLMGGM